MIYSELLDKAIKIAEERLENFQTSLYDRWYNSNTCLSYDEWLSDFEKEKIKCFKQDIKDLEN
jgi:hypothetical protein